MIDNTRQTFFSPDDALDIKAVDFLKQAKHKIRVADYSFNLKPFIDALVAQYKAGIDVALVLDRSQAAGSTEVPEIAVIKAAGVPHVIGTSEKHKIMHNKFIVVDDTWVLSGSFNFTAAAEEENNFFDIEHSISRAAAFTAQWQKMHDWIKLNEPQ